MIKEELEKILKTKPQENLEDDIVVDNKPLNFLVIKKRVGYKSTFSMFHNMNRLENIKCRENFSLVKTYEGFLTDRGKKIYSFSFPETARLFDIATGFCDGIVNNQVFFLSKTDFFLDLENTEFLKSLSSIIDTQKQSFKSINTIFKDITIDINDFIFFDGKKNLRMEILKSFFIYDFRVKLFICPVRSKIKLCYICFKNNSEIEILDNHILPKNNVFLCKKCFEYTFLDKAGNLIHPGIYYRKYK